MTPQSSDIDAAVELIAPFIRDGKIYTAIKTFADLLGIEPDIKYIGRQISLRSALCHDFLPEVAHICRQLQCGPYVLEDYRLMEDLLDAVLDTRRDVFRALEPIMQKYEFQLETDAVYFADAFFKAHYMRGYGHALGARVRDDTKHCIF